MFVNKHSYFLALGFLTGDDVICTLGMLSVTPSGLDSRSASRISLRFCWSSLFTCMLIYLFIRSRGLQARWPGPVVRARGAGSPTDRWPPQNALLGLGCDRTTSLATEWGGWTQNGDLTLFRRSTGPGPGGTDRERACRATMKILSRCSLDATS